MSLSCLTHIENHIAPIFANSARLVNTVGNYNGCLDTQGMNYFAVSLADLKGNPFGGMAFCLPEECSNNSVKEVLSYLL